MGPPGTTLLVTRMYTHKNAQAHKLHSYIMLDYLGCIYTKNVTSYKVMFFCRASLAHWESSLLSAEAFNDLQGDYADAVLPFDHAGRGAAGGCWVKSWELLHHLDSHTGPSTHEWNPGSKWVAGCLASARCDACTKLCICYPLETDTEVRTVTAVSPYPLILIRASLLKPVVR